MSSSRPLPGPQLSGPRQPGPQLTRRQIYRRRRLVVFGGLAVILAVVLSVFVYGVSAFAAPVPATAAVLQQPAAAAQPAAQLAWPGYGSAAIGAVGRTELLGTSGDQASVPIASITKIVTALVILDAKPLAAGEAGPDIQFTDADVDIYYDTIAENGSSAPVTAGMVLTQRQALETMLLPSANNYSVSLAVWAYGSVDAYLQAATAWLTEKGLTQTSVADTSGLSPASVSSPGDLVKLGMMAVADPTLSTIVSEATADIPTIGAIENTNTLLGTGGVDGIKTGTTDEAGACLLFSADVVVGSQTVTLVGVILGGQDHTEVDASVLALVASAQAGFHEVVLTTAGTTFGSYTTAWGQNSSLVATDDATALIWSDTPVTAVVTAAPVQLADADEKTGTVSYTIGDQTIDVPLETSGAITDPGLGWRLGNPGELFG
ncbi:D-alanyl-D-alanine carboxypeptidase family protein [Compostimonas suwonensis]|uniref:D-alanyl-D-alanine carboxypeptidase (Penicillin-binding protein 5/6) n=1 Tax=Compostimonas suwonensis TaxID=1048394 RepID=A0A2M9BYQ9_9MICO|nr:D-alanyl-D-alanine carboxypeptidase [Compostimonas suwonensis]PJJ63217.1 D-alanyl-D-alanine carboxypeptidase (penicillin-binding protein 5/6) [Compostimonas suwonensis]